MANRELRGEEREICMHRRSMAAYIHANLYQIGTSQEAELNDAVGYVSALAQRTARVSFSAIKLRQYNLSCGDSRRFLYRVFQDWA